LPPLQWTPYPAGDRAQARRKAFIRKWRMKCRAVADSLEEAGDKLFTLHALPAQPMEIDPNLECDRAIVQGVTKLPLRVATFAASGQ